MILPDVNILIYAHRTESPSHQKVAEYLKGLAEGLNPFAMCSFVCSGFLRIVTNHRIFAEPTPLEVALSFLENLLHLEHCRIIEPFNRHWEIFTTLTRDAKATANLISDAYVASIALEHGCTLLTSDSDFRKFPQLACEFLK